ncbi:MAG: hypothetical protein ACRC7A_05020, partial [Acinetobacter junii]
EFFFLIELEIVYHHEGVLFSCSMLYSISSKIFGIISNMLISSDPKDDGKKFINEIGGVFD